MMSNSTFLKAITTFSIKKIKNQKNIKYLGTLILFVFMGFSVNAQNSFNSADGWGAGWGTGLGFSPSAGSSLIYMTTNSSGSGNRYFRFYGTGTPCGQYGPVSASQQLQTDMQYNNTTLTCGNETYAYYLDVSNNTDNYVFKSAASTAAKIVIFKIQGAVRSVSTVTQSPLAASVTQCHATTVTATLDGALAVGQGVYMRYTKDGYANSTVVPLTGSGTIYTGTIPSAFNTVGATVSYYLFTSGTTTASGADADFYTINLNNNGAANYSYVVAAGGATTYIPDNNFEQALIDLGLDCTLDDYVFTSNISDVTELNIESKGISNLTGIEAFSSLLDLYCADNSLESLNVNMLSNLRFLDCQNNALTSLNITGLSNLTQMVCWFNNLTSLDLGTTPNLIYLDCDDNAFTVLDVSALTHLNQFYCSNNLLTGLDVRGLASLYNFECTGNLSLSCILVDDVNAANTAIITIDPESDTPFWTKDPGASYSYCDCDLTTTWNGSGWSDGVPTNGTYAAIIAGNYNESANISACTLTVNNNAIVVIPSGYNVTLNAPLTVISGSFTLGNNANLIQSTNVANSGNITVNRNSNSLYRLDYAMWSSPVSGTQTLADFSPLTSTNRFYEYDAAANLYTDIDNTGTFGLAKGYLIRMPNDASAVTPTAYPGVFTGVPNNGTINVTTVASQYNGVGNPYPSVIDAELFKASNTDVNSLYFWRKTNNVNQGISPTTSYATYNIATSTGVGVAPDGAAAGQPTITPDKYIQVGQGFLFTTAQTSVVFNNGMRAANNSNKILKTKTVERNRIWLNLSNSSWPINQMALCYMNGTTQGLDEADSKYFNDSQTALNSLISNEEYVIQGRALPFDGTDVVPLAFKTAAAGDFTIAIDHVDGLFSGSQDIILKDNTTGAETDLKAGAYTFTAGAGVDNARFSLKYQRNLGVNVAAFNDNNITVYKNKGVLYVDSDSVAIANVKVYDIQGRLLVELKNVKSTSATINNLKGINQVLVVKITAQDNTVVNKKVVN